MGEDRKQRALPAAYGGNYRPAGEEAARRLAAGDPLAMAENSGAGYDAGKRVFTLSFAGETYFIGYPGGEVQSACGEPVADSDRTLLILYLVGASGLPLRGRWLSFLELPSGSHHWGPFQGDGLRPLAQTFGTAPARLREAGRKMGAAPLEMGDCGIVVPALPRLPLAVAVWQGDEEFPPRATILFDAVAPTYLDTAGLFVLGINTALRLCRAAGAR